MATSKQAAITWCHAYLSDKEKPLEQGLEYGAGTTNRTRDLLITSQLLYQLSYAGNFASYSRLGGLLARLLLPLAKGANFIVFTPYWQVFKPAGYAFGKRRSRNSTYAATAR